MRIRVIIIAIFVASVISAQSPDSLWNNSLKCYNVQNFHGMIENLDTLITLAPDFPEAYYNRALAKTSLGNMDDACADFEHAQLLGANISKEFVEYECSPEFIRDLMLKQFYKDETVYPETGFRPRYTRADTLRGALRPERNCFNVYFYDLTVRIIPKTKRIRANTEIYFQIVQPTRKIQIDLFDNYEITAIVWNNKPLTWYREFNAIFIHFPEELKNGEKHNIRIEYNGKPLIAPNPPWDGGFVWKRDKNNDLWLGVACEHLGASSWWPTKDHLTDKPDSFEITLEVPKGYKAVSNGDLRKTSPVDKHYDSFTWFTDYPINNYNVTFYVGKYVSFGDTLIDGRDTIPLDYNVLAHNLDTAKKHFLQTREVVKFYNKAFGVYPFVNDGFGLVESPYEGMEHQSAIAYGHGYTKNNANDYRNDIYDYIIVHEAAHEWWGNSVTAADMADIWIHEGFATYAEFMFLEDRLGKDEYFYELTDNSRYIFNVWPMVQNRDVNENAFASNDVYNKGAMMLHCLRCTMNNDTLFFKLVKDFCSLNKYKVVNTADFIHFVNTYTGMDYTAFFKKYLYDTTLPVLEYYYSQDNSGLSINYRWNGVDEGFYMPFGISTSSNESMRLVAETSWKEIKIPGATWFNFYNLWKGYEGAAEHSYTYYNSKLIKPIHQSVYNY